MATSEPIAATIMLDVTADGATVAGVSIREPRRLLVARKGKVRFLFLGRATTPFIETIREMLVLIGRCRSYVG